MRRRSSGLSAVRAGAALVALASAVAIYGVSASSAFDYARMRLDPAPAYTDPADIEAALAGVRGENLFRLDTAPLASAVSDLRTVASAKVTVELPDTLLVSVRERVPILVWEVGARRYLVDASGLLFAMVGKEAGTDAAALPSLVDHRAVSAALSVGVTLDSVVLDAATRLGSLVPADIGTGAERLTISLTDENGFVMRTKPASWNAVFGFYTASLRKPDMIPGQVRLLRSLLIGHEASIERVILASEKDGTFVPKPTPTADPSLAPSPTPTPAATSSPTEEPVESPSPTP